MNVIGLLLDKIVKAQQARCTVRVEVRGRTHSHEFNTLPEAQVFWDRAHKYGMNIDARPA